MDTPTSYTDFVAGGNEISGIIYWAYLFLENNTVKLSSKEIKDGVATFKKEDFEKSINGEYSVQEDILNVVFDKNQKWEVRIKFKVDRNQLTNVESNTAGGTGQIYNFNEWL